MFKLLSWNDFKLLLFDFYDHRIQNQAELTGAINNQYVNFDEYMLIFFLDKYKTR